MHRTRPTRHAAKAGQEKRLASEAQARELEEELKNKKRTHDEAFQSEEEESYNGSDDDDFLCDDEQTDDDDDIEDRLRMHQIRKILKPFADALGLTRQAAERVMRCLVNRSCWYSHFTHQLAEDWSLSHEDRFPAAYITPATLCSTAFTYLSKQPEQAGGMLSYKQFEALFDFIFPQAENVAWLLEDGMNAIFYSPWFPDDFRKPKFLSWTDPNRNESFLGQILLCCMVVGLYRPYFATNLEFEVRDHQEDKRPPPIQVMTIITEIYLLEDKKEAERLRANLACTSRKFYEFLEAHGKLERDTKHMHAYLTDAGAYGKGCTSAGRQGLIELNKKNIEACKYALLKCDASGKFVEIVGEQLRRGCEKLKDKLPPKLKLLKFVGLLDDPLRISGSSGSSGPYSNITMCMTGLQGVTGFSFQVQVPGGTALWNAVESAGNKMKTDVELRDRIQIKNRKIMSQSEMTKEIGDMLENLQQKTRDKEVTVFYNGMPVKPEQVIVLEPKRSILTVAATTEKFLARCLKQLFRGLSGTPTRVDRHSFTHRAASDMGEGDFDNDNCIFTKFAYGPGAKCIKQNMIRAFKRANEGRSRAKWYKLGAKLCNSASLLEFPNKAQHTSRIDQQRDGKIHDCAVDYRLTLARLVAQKDSNWRVGHPFRKIPESEDVPIFEREINNHDLILILKHYKLACKMASLLEPMQEDYPARFEEASIALFAIHRADKKSNPSFDWTRALDDLNQTMPSKSTAERFLEGI